MRNFPDESRNVAKWKNAEEPQTMTHEEQAWPPLHGSGLRKRINLNGFTVGLGFFLTLILTVFLSVQGCKDRVEAWPTAPDFTLEDLNFNKVSLNHYRGKIVLLDFWATWCGPCRMTIPELVRLNDKYGEQGLVILGISVDNPEHVNNHFLLAFKEEFKVNYTILRSSRKVTQDYFGIDRMAIPTLFLINREGRIVDKYVGFAPGALERSLEKLL
jgi:thiol-disulfide isomerase/thioredoxin